MSVASTLSPGEAGARPWDATVVGAGPAGALAARELARRGLRTLLIDRATFPRPKVCGGCLNGRALATLDSVGLGDLPARAGAVPLGALVVAARGRKASVPLRANVAVSRASLDAALVAAAVRAGSAFLGGTRAEVGAVDGPWRCLRLHGTGGDAEVRAGITLAATGLGSRPLARQDDVTDETADGSRVGAGVIVPEAPAEYGAGTVFMACAAAGYVGLVRVEGGQLDVAAALGPQALRDHGGPGRAAEAVLADAGFPPVPRLAERPWRGTPMLTRRASHLAAERVLVLGDAAGYVEPFTGEGMAWALAAAVAVAPLAARASRCWIPGLAAEWEELYRRTVARRQRVCRVVAGVLRRPVLTRLFVEMLALAPRVAGPVLRSLNGSPGKRRLAVP